MGDLVRVGSDWAKTKGKGKAWEKTRFARARMAREDSVVNHCKDISYPAGQALIQAGLNHDTVMVWLNLFIRCVSRRRCMNDTLKSLSPRPFVSR